MSRSAAEASAQAQSGPDAPSSTRRRGEPPARVVAGAGGDRTRVDIKDGPPQGKHPRGERLSPHTGGDGWANQCHHAMR
jgi:hypothetical protein